MDVRRIEVDVVGVAPAGASTVVVDLVLPDDPPVAVACCFPGGGMSRRYWDLWSPELPGYSMARFLAGAGVAVMAVDHLGIGESSRPFDAYTLTPAVLADVNARVCSVVAAPLGVPMIGVAHSMGGLLAVHQQARYRSFAALALLGFSGSGLPGVLTESEMAFAGRPVELAAALPGLVEARFGSPLPVSMTASSDFLIAGVSVAPARALLAGAATALLALAGLTAMIPGVSAAELRALEVPVFVGLGERDIAGPACDLPAQLPGCRDITLYVLAGSGHNHVIADNRAELWARLAAWARSVIM